MKIYSKVQRFNSKTGKPYKVWEYKETRCDFSGKLIDEDDLENKSFPTYILDYESSDPCFGSCGDEYEFGEKYNVDMFQFLSQDYQFYNNIGCCESINMMMKFINDKMSFADMCRTSRIMAAEKLILDGVITSDQLSDELNR